MLGQIWIQTGAPVKAGIIVLDDFLEGLKAPIVHVRPSQGDIAKRRGDEKIPVSLPPRNELQTQIEVIWNPVVMKPMIGKECAPVAVKSIRAFQAAALIIFGHKEFEPSFFHFGELALSPGSLVKTRVIRGPGQ